MDIQALKHCCVIHIFTLLSTSTIAIKIVQHQILFSEKNLFGKNSMD